MKGCPTPDCEGFLTKPPSNGDQEVKCFSCEKCYCYRCLYTPHPGETCDQKIDKDYEQWAIPNKDVGICKNCNIKIEKEGGCPNMIC